MDLELEILIAEEEVIELSNKMFFHEPEKGDDYFAMQRELEKKVSRLIELRNERDNARP